MEKIKNYINGELLAPNSGEYINNFCPGTGKAYSLIPDSDAHDAEMAVEAAQKAFKSWSTIPKQERSDILLNLAISSCALGMFSFIPVTSNNALSTTLFCNDLTYEQPILRLICQKASTCV